MADKKNIIGFKRFSDIKKSKIEDLDLSDGIKPGDGHELPMNPNLPLDSKKIEKPSRGKMMPQDQDINLPNDDDLDSISKKGDKTDEANESNVSTFGKVALFPKNVKASKAYNFLENVKVSKKSIWYIMIEKQGNELQMVKYNNKEGVDLSSFVNELKTYYKSTYLKDKNVCRLIEKIHVDGNDKYSMIKNIPLVEVDGVKMITKITEDLIKLLSK